MKHEPINGVKFWFCSAAFIFAVFVVVSAALFWMGKCRAEVSYFVEAGQSNYERPSGSLWQQDFAGYPTMWDMRPLMFRVGLEVNHFRLSYADLGKYGISAEAGDDEDFIQDTRQRCTCDTDTYYTTGSIRAILASYRPPSWRGFFIEGGIGAFRQSLKIEKDDGWRFNDKLWGFGYMVGVGVEGKHLSIGVYTYQTNIGANFGKGAYPAGTGGANVVAVGYRF